MNPDVLLLAERLVVAVERISQDVNNISAYVHNLSYSVSHFINEKREKDITPLVQSNEVANLPSGSPGAGQEASIVSEKVCQYDQSCGSLVSLADDLQQVKTSAGRVPSMSVDPIGDTVILSSFTEEIKIEEQIESEENDESCDMHYSYDNGQYNVKLDEDYDPLQNEIESVVYNNQEDALKVECGTQHDNAVEKAPASPSYDNFAAPKRRRVNHTNIIEEYLKEGTIAASIKANYYGSPSNPKPKEKHGLDHSFQRKLGALIIEKELNQTNSDISVARLSELADAIVEYFPAEKKGVYFIPYSSVIIDNKRAQKNSAKGILWNRYTNQTKELRKNGLRERRRASPAASASLNEPRPIPHLDVILKFLEGQREISDAVTESWKKTSQYRLYKLQSERVQCPIGSRTGVCHVNNYMTLYPFLRQPGGYFLLEYDFNRAYPGYSHKLFENWAQFSASVIELAGLNPDDAHGEATILLSFCDIITNKQKMRRVTKMWTANSTEIAEGFILHVKSRDSLVPDINRIVKRAAEYKLHVSPFAVVVGSTPETITDSYLYIDGVRYPASSPRHAIDKAFKAVHALHANYQEQSRSIWLLFQRVVYGLLTKWDIPCTIVEDLVPKFQKVQI